MTEEHAPLDDDLPPSKTQRKKAMQALQQLGEDIVALPAGELALIPLDDDLQYAIEQARGMTKREAKRRQLQYIGKLMRKRDVTDIEQAMQNLRDGRKQLTREFHKLETLRDQLLENPNDLEPALRSFPTIDRQHLRQLLRQADKERGNNQPPAAARKLFRYLREMAEL